MSTLSLEDIDRAIAFLKANNVLPADDGFYRMQVHPKNVTKLVIGFMAENTADKWHAREEELRRSYVRKA